MNITIEISDERIKNFLFGFDASFSGWIYSITGDDLNEGVSVRYDDPDDGEGTYRGVTTVTTGHVQRGLEIMALEEPEQFSLILDEQEDAYTVDIAWQCIILGEVVYG